MKLGFYLKAGRRRRTCQGLISAAQPRYPRNAVVIRTEKSLRVNKGTADFSQMIAVIVAIFLTTTFATYSQSL
jgi:hypothetical protein